MSAGPLFDFASREKAREARDDGMKRVEEHAPENWKTLAWDRLTEYLRSHEEFFAPDFWNVAQLPKPPEARALGALVMRAARERMIVKAGYKQSTDPASHLCPRAVWRSLVYRGGRAA